MISFEQPIVQLYCNCHAKVDHAVHGKAAGFERAMHAVMQTPCFFSSWSVQPKGALTWDFCWRRRRGRAVARTKKPSHQQPAIQELVGGPCVAFGSVAGVGFATTFKLP